LLAAALAAVATTAGAAGRAAGAAADAAVVAAGAGAAAGASPARAAISASVNRVWPVRLRRACSAATADLLHFGYEARSALTVSVIPGPEAALAAAGATPGDAGGVAGAGVAKAGAAGDGAAAAAGTPSPRSHGIGSPALRAAMSSSLSSGRPDRLRYACSAAITELLAGLRGQGGRLPSTPLMVFVCPSDIRRHPFVGAARNGNLRGSCQSAATRCPVAVSI